MRDVPNSIRSFETLEPRGRRRNGSASVAASRWRGSRRTDEIRERLAHRHLRSFPTALDIERGRVRLEGREEFVPTALRSTASIASRTAPGR